MHLLKFLYLLLLYKSAYFCMYFVQKYVVCFTLGEISERLATRCGHAANVMRPRFKAACIQVSAPARAAIASRLQRSPHYGRVMLRGAPRFPLSVKQTAHSQQCTHVTCKDLYL